MIFFDTTKTAAAGHHSGLMRVSTRLRAELGAAATSVRWPEWRGEGAGAADWFVTAEIFSPEERPGFSAWLETRACRCAAIFHDAIPLKHPHITWPQSVARHPSYLKMLSRFDRVWAVSDASRRELIEFWRWQGVEKMPAVDVLELGADFSGQERTRTRASRPAASLLCLGILEPRKNQLFLLEVAEALWREGAQFELHIVGRVNPHFGPPIVKRIAGLRRTFGGLKFLEAASDEIVQRLYAQARASVFPTIAEGCGLPLLESLWMGVPCVCSDLPVLRENASAGGCLQLPLEVEAWKTGLRRVLTDDAFYGELAAAAGNRPLPTWADAAGGLRRAFAAG